MSLGLFLRGLLGEGADPVFMRTTADDSAALIS